MTDAHAGMDQGALPDARAAPDADMRADPRPRPDRYIRADDNKGSDGGPLGQLRGGVDDHRGVDAGRDVGAGIKGARQPGHHQARARRKDRGLQAIGLGVHALRQDGDAAGAQLVCVFRGHGHGQLATLGACGFHGGRFRRAGHPDRRIAPALRVQSPRQLTHRQDHGPPFRARA